MLFTNYKVLSICDSSVAHDLAKGDHGGFNDPYIRLFISPEVDNRKRETNTHRNESNPFFDEHFKFPVSQEDMKEKVLLLQVRQSTI
jgi:Ca2+-dependent lipid-binding protein